MCIADVSGGRVWGRSWLGWMDGVKMVLGSRGMMAEAARNLGRSGESWRICRLFSLTLPFLHGPVFFRTSLIRSGGLSPGEEWDAVMRLR